MFPSSPHETSPSIPLFISIKSRCLIIKLPCSPCLMVMFFFVMFHWWIINGGIHTTIFIGHVFAFHLKLHHVSPCLIVKTATSNPWPDGPMPMSPSQMFARLDGEMRGAIPKRSIRTGVIPKHGPMKTICQNIFLYAWL